VSALDCEGRTIWIADAHRDDGKRFVVRADEKLTAGQSQACRVSLFLPNIILPSGNQKRF